MIEDTDLIRKLIEGDRISFEKLVKQFKNKVFNTSLIILQNVEDAEDITQEVFVEVFQSLKNFKGESKLSSWIYRIAVLKSLEFLRWKNRKKRFGFMQSLSYNNLTESNFEIPNFFHPGIQLENKERAAILFAAIHKLPENQKTAFILHKTEGLSYAEVADVMQVTVSSVESLLFRAKQSLQKLLGDYYEKNEK